MPPEFQSEKWKALKRLDDKRTQDVRFLFVLREVFKMRSGPVLAIAKRAGVDAEETLRHCRDLQDLGLVELAPSNATDAFATYARLSQKALELEVFLRGFRLLW